MVNLSAYLNDIPRSQVADFSLSLVCEGFYHNKIPTAIAVPRSLLLILLRQFKATNKILGRKPGSRFLRAKVSRQPLSELVGFDWRQIKF